MNNKKRPIYRNQATGRIHRNGYLDALQDIVNAANRGGLEDVLRWAQENGGGQIDMDGRFEED